MKIEVNQNNLIRNLGSVFSNNVRFIGELIQNARRAQATQLKITWHDKGSEYDGGYLEHDMLEFVDNGIGINDFSKLLTIADSGWNEATQASEQPYGMGFLSSVFACERMKIESLGQLMSFNCADLIAGGSANLSDYPMNEGARFILINPKIDKKKLEDQVEAFSCGLEMTVYLNGEVIENSCRPSLCEIEIPGIGVAHVGNSDRISDYRVFFQGMQMDGARHYWVKNFIHVTTLQFKARMPDRSAFINHDEVMNIIDKAWREHVVKEQIKNAIAEKNACLVDRLLRSSSIDMVKYALSLACIPSEAMLSVDWQRNETLFDVQDAKFISQDWFEKDTDFSYDENLMRMAYIEGVNKRGSKIIPIRKIYADMVETIDPKLAITLDSAGYSISIDTNYMRCHFEDYGVSVSRAKSITVSSELGEIVMSSETGFGNVMVLPTEYPDDLEKGVEIYLFGDQPDFSDWFDLVYNFEDENSVYREEWEEDQRQIVLAQLLTLYETTTEQRLMQVYANELRWILINAGVAGNEQFTISLDENKDLVIKKVA